MAKSKAVVASVNTSKAGTKKIWIIKQAPEHFSQRREELREVRRQLNKAAGVDELSPEFMALTPAEKVAKVAYTMTMGPDHPHYQG